MRIMQAIFLIASLCLMPFIVYYIWQTVHYSRQATRGHRELQAKIKRWQETGKWPT
jgi:hypothetical protein